MIIKEAKFVTSVASCSCLPSSPLPMVAFVGRSNVGKSSLINCLTNSKNLAKTSSTPGRTRLINFFLINNNFHLVDLPGYGYAEAGKEHKENWATLLEEYLANSKINLIFLLVDIRHKPTDLDKQMMRFLFQSGLAFKIVATKADKIPKSKISVYIKIVANELMLGTGDIVPFSCETKKGKEEILALIDRFCFKQPNDSDLINFDDENKQGE